MRIEVSPFAAAFTEAPIVKSQRNIAPGREGFGVGRQKQGLDAGKAVAEHDARGSGRLTAPGGGFGDVKIGFHFHPFGVVLNFVFFMVHRMVSLSLIVEILPRDHGKPYRHS